jgi:hypothetical protein
MDPLTTVIGVVCICFGLYTAIVRVKSPQKFVKLEAMKQKFGNNTGIFIHKVAYTFLPLVFGVIITFAGIKGISLR